MRRTLPVGYSRGVLVGKGTFGTVFRAREDELGRWVALKEVPRGDVGAREEAQTLAAAALPCLPAIYGVETARRSDWIAMEYVHGISLRDALALGLEPFEAAAWAASTVRSLAVLHRSGRAHGDLKPENLIAEPDGRVRLVDLGMAALSTDSVQGGTVGYLAPERGRPGCDPRRADLWSLGALLHELLVGVRPTAQEGAGGWKRLLKQAPDWVGVIDLLLREDPARRPASAESLLSELPSVDPLPPSCLERIREQADRSLANRMVGEASYRLRHGEPAEALGYLQQALELDPDQSDALALLPQIRLDRVGNRRRWRLVAALAGAAVLASVALAVALSGAETGGATVNSGAVDEGNDRVRIDRGGKASPSLPLREGGETRP